jgi:hypothetical protein
LTRRLLIALPFAFAGVFNLLSLVAYRLHWNPQDIAGYGFLFVAPWGWLVDVLFVNIHNRWLATLHGYTVMLWVPALLYSSAFGYCLGASKSLRFG